MGINIYQKGRIPSCMLSDKKVEIKIDLDNSQNEVPNLIATEDGNIFDLDRHIIQTCKRPDKKLGFSIGSCRWAAEEECLCPQCGAFGNSIFRCGNESQEIFKCGCGYKGRFPEYFLAIDRFYVIPEKVVKQILAMRVARATLKEKEAELLASGEIRRQKLTAKYLQEKVKRRGIHIPLKYFK